MISCIENINKGNEVKINKYNFIFLWFHSKGIDLQVKNNIQIIHIPLSSISKVELINNIFILTLIS